MKTPYIIRLVRSKKKYFKIDVFYICVTYRKRNSIIVDKLGTIFYWEKKKVCFLDSYKVGYWLNKGCDIKPKVSFFFSMSQWKG